MDRIAARIQALGVVAQSETSIEWTGVAEDHPCSGEHCVSPKQPEDGSGEPRNR